MFGATHSRSTPPASSNPAAEPAPPSRSGWRRAVLFRLLAVLLGLLPLLICELVLRGIGLGKPTDFDDPFIGFSDIHPLFVLNPETGRYEIPKSRQSHFRPDSFLAKKPANEFRVFVLGGSTVQGRPYAIETAFPAWLELSLGAADPSRTFRVVNCGGISYASYRLTPILREVLNYEPDLVIFCEGHNEFLEDRAYGDLRVAPVTLAWPQRQVARLRTYNLLREGVLRLAGSGQQTGADKPVLGPETDAMLDWKDGIAKYHRDPAWHAAVATHFGSSLRQIVAIAEAKGVPLLIVSPVSNLQWPPFKPEPRPDLSEDERQQIEALESQASKKIGPRPAEALPLLEQAAAIDDQNAQLQYDLGMCLRELGQMEKSRDVLLLAKDLDVCPLRMLEPMKRSIRRVAEETGTPFVDADALIASRSRSGYPDNQWLIDHVHPTMEGHQLIAEAIQHKLIDLGYIRPIAGWEAARDREFVKHLSRLSHAYFERGQTFLRAEQNWAHGRATKVRKSQDKPVEP